MRLKNYTTTVNHAKTINEIESLLTSIGARRIMKEYDDNQKVIAITFDLEVMEKRVPFRMPSRIDRVPGALRKIHNEEKSSSKRNLIKKSMNKPENIGWRIIKDWLEANIAIMTLDQVNMAEALLPFAVVDPQGKETLYQLLERNEFNFGATGRNLLEYQG